MITFGAAPVAPAPVATDTVRGSNFLTQSRRPGREAPRPSWSPLHVEQYDDTRSQAEEQPRRRADYVFGPALVPASEWHFAYPLFPLPDVPMTSYADEIARGAA